MRLHCVVAKKLDHLISFAGAFTEIIELAVPTRGNRFVFDLRPAACLNNDRYGRVDYIAIEKRRELASCPSAQSLHTTRAGSDAASSVAHASFWKARTSCSGGDMRSDVLVRAAAAVALVACGVAHSADLQPVVSEPRCLQPHEQPHCFLWHCCDRRLQGRSTRLCHRNRTCGSFLLARPNSGVYRSSRGLKRQSRPISPTAARSGKGPMRRSRGKGRNSITVVSMGPAEPALSKRSHRLGPSDLSASV